MSETHARGMEGGWNSSEVWPVPVPDCLLNGMNGTEDETQNMFGGNHMLQQQFRSRFQPPMHFTSSHLMPIPGSINVNIPIPAHAHSMIENSGQVQVDNNGSGPSLTSDENAPARISQNIQMDQRDVLDDTDEVSDDEDDEEVDEEMSAHMPHVQDVGQLSMSHSMSGEGLVQAQCQQVPGAVQDSLVHPRQTSMIPMNEVHCHHPKLSMNGSDMTVHQHPIHPQPPNANTMDQIFGQQSDAYDAEPDQDGSNDPNSGFSVCGKMYFEGRVVLHLKQSGDSDLGIVGGGVGGMGFSSCGVPEPQKPHLHGCAFCRLRSPQATLRSQKEAHRHTVKGVLFTFEDCIIVELYPEQINGLISNPTGQKPTNPQAKPESLSNQPVPLSEYLTPTTMALPDVPQLSSETNVADSNQMEFNPINEQQSQVPSSISSSGPKGVNVHSSAPEDHHWWDEFESEGEDDMKETGNTTEEEESNQPSDYRHSSTYLRPSNEDEDEEEEDEDECPSGEGEYSSPSYKCNECSGVFHSSIQLNTHPCHTIDSITNFTSSCSSANANDFCPTGNLIVSPNIGELVLSPERAGNIAHLDHENIKCTSSETEIKLISPVSAGDDSCQDSLGQPSNSNRPDTTKKKSNINLTVKKKRKFSCPSCDKSFPLKKNLKAHLEVEHSEGNPYRCHNCSLQLTDECQIGKHTCSVKSQRRIKRLQTLNKRKLPVPSELKYPSTSPQVFEIVEYPELEASAQPDLSKQDPQKKNKANKHKESKSKSKRRNEDKLEYMAKSLTQKIKAELGEHKEVNSEEIETPRIRLKSKKRRTSGGVSNNYKYNLKKSTLEIKTRKPFKNSRKPFSCEICGKGFTMQLRLDKHRHSHATEKSSQCEKCGKRFARKDKLMRHMFVHNEVKMFSCDICDKRFSRRDKLTDHLRSHGGPEEIHKCAMCEKEFLRPDILKQHEKLHTMANKHQCPECLRFVTGRDRLEQHMARHEEAKAQGQTLLCPLCTKVFIQRQSLKAHIKRFHPTAHKIILSALDFPPNKESDGDHEAEEPEDSSESSSKEVPAQRYSCEECPFPKYFSAVAAFARHMRHHHQKSTRTEERERARLKLNNHKHNSRKMSRCKRPLYQEVEEAERAKTPEADEKPQESKDPTSPCIFTSAASQIVSPSPQSPVAPCHSPNLTTLEPLPAHSVLPVQHSSTEAIQHFSPRRQLLHDLQLASSVPPPHHTLSLTVSPSGVVSSHQQNGLLGLSSHGLHHHLLQHSHGHGHSLQMGQGFPHATMPHPLGQQVSMSTLHHHLNVNMANVNMTSQHSLCGNPYLVYQHSHYPYQ